MRLLPKFLLLLAALIVVTVTAGTVILSSAAARGKTEVQTLVGMMAGAPYGHMRNLAVVTRRMNFVISYFQYHALYKRDMSEPLVEGTFAVDMNPGATLYRINGQLEQAGFKVIPPFIGQLQNTTYYSNKQRHMVIEVEEILGRKDLAYYVEIRYYPHWYADLD